ncbi:14660_t:CDS:1, partial [Acaulospora colombiana]
VQRQGSDQGNNDALIGKGSNDLSGDFLDGAVVAVITLASYEKGTGK